MTHNDSPLHTAAAQKQNAQLIPARNEPFRLVLAAANNRDDDYEDDEKRAPSADQRVQHNWVQACWLVKLYKNKKIKKTAPRPTEHTKRVSQSVGHKKNQMASSATRAHTHTHTAVGGREHPRSRERGTRTM